MTGSQAGPRSYARDFVGDMAGYIPALLAPGVLSIIAVYVLTHRFAPTQYGYYTLIVAAVASLVTFMGWLSSAVVRFYAAHEQRGDLPVLLSSILRFGGLSVAALGVLGALALWAVSGDLQPEVRLLAWIALGAFAGSTFYDLLRSVLRARRAVKCYSASVVARSAAELGLGLFFIFALGSGIHGFLLGTLLATLLVLPFQWRTALQGIPLRGAGLDLALVRRLASYGLPLAAAGLSTWVLSLSDRYVLKLFVSADEVGIYSASYAVADRPLALLLALFFSAFGPIAVRIWEQGDQGQARAFVSLITRYYLILALPAVAGLTALSGPIAEVFLGPAYYRGHGVIPWVSVGVLLLGLQQRYIAGFMFARRTRFIAVATALCGGVNVLLNLLFVPRFGFQAAAVNTLVGYALLLLIVIPTSRRHFVWPFPFATLARCLAAAALMALVLRFAVQRELLPVNIPAVMALVAGGALVYGLLLAASGEIRSELRAAAAWLRRSPANRGR